MWTISRNSIGQIKRRKSTKSWRPLSTTQTIRAPKPYKSIPGPNVFQFYTGKYHNLFPASRKALIEEYGPIVKVPGLLNKSDTVMINDPNDFDIIFRADGQYPDRTMMKIFEHYWNYVCPIKYHFDGGLATKHGEEWYKLRTVTNPILLKPTILSQHISKSDEIAIDFIERIKKIRDNNNEVPADFILEINKWTVEEIAYLAFGTRLNLLDSQPGGRGMKYLNTIYECVDLSGKLEYEFSLWEHISTPTYRKFLKSADTLAELSIQFVDENMKGPSTTSDVLIKTLWNIDRAIALSVGVEFLVAGMSNISLNFVNLMYLLATNPEKQERLRKEILSLPVDEKGNFKRDVFKHAPYLRACFKESMRVLPVTEGVNRFAGKDVEIKGYSVPKGTTVIMLMQCQQDDRFFKNPSEYIPERWLRDGELDARPELKNNHPLGYLPFGYGTRSCIGRRIAEMETFILTARLMKNFRMEYNYPKPMTQDSKVPTPPSNLKFKMIDI